MIKKFHLFLLVPFLILSSCTRKESDTNIFRYNEAQGIENLDPVMCSNYPAIWPVMQCMEGLVEFDKEMNLDPLLAESYSISDDGLVYTFQIKKGVYFHDDECFPDKRGRMLNSYDFKYCFERLCNPGTKTRGLWLFRDRVKGAAEYINSIQNNKLDVKEISGIQCPDKTVCAVLEHTHHGLHICLSP